MEGNSFFLWQQDLQKYATYVNRKHGEHEKSAFNFLFKNYN
jgi:hypothetical protein